MSKITTGSAIDELISSSTALKICLSAWHVENKPQSEMMSLSCVLKGISLLCAINLTTEVPQATVFPLRHSS